MASTDARPLPIRATAFRVIFPILDADGDFVTGATGLDSEVSKDQGTFADCTNEATEIATASGMYYLDLTSTEMTADCVAIIVKTTSSGAKTTPIVLYPEETGDINVDVTAWAGTAAADLYTADIQFTRDQTNTQDEWTVTAFKNGVRITSGITSPTLQLIKRVDGTDLKAATGMTQIGSTGSYKLDLLTTDRVTVGEAVIAVFAATIDAGSRAFSRLIGRDSS